LARGVAIVLLVVITVAGCEIRTSSAASAVDRLHRMLAAERSLEYEGMRDLVRFYGSRERRSYCFVQHYSNGPTIVESAGRSGGSRRWVERRGRLYWLADKNLLLRNYVVEEKGRRTVSERNGLVLSITSRHEGRPSIEVVVDEETSLLLSSEFRNYLGETSFRSSFQTLLIDPGLPARSPKEGRERKGDVERVQKSSRKALPVKMLEPRYLPEGFVRKASWKSRRSPRINTIYSDGLSWIQLSLSEAEAGSPERVVEQSRSGSRTTMKMVLSGVHIRLVGRLDPEELLEVLRSMAERVES
jgi:negative regulator of sigma E activity